MAKRHLLFVCYLCRWSINDNQLSRNCSLLLDFSIICALGTNDGTKDRKTTLLEGAFSSISIILHIILCETRIIYIRKIQKLAQT